MRSRPHSLMALVISAALLASLPGTAAASPAVTPASAAPAPEATPAPAPEATTAPAPEAAPEPAEVLAPEATQEPAPVEQPPADAVVEAAPDATQAAALDEVDPAGAAQAAVEEPATDEEAVALGSADDVLVVQGEPALVEADQTIVGLTAPLGTDGHDVVVLGASWESAASEVRVDLRVMRDGAWGEWVALPVETVGEDGQTRAGTEPYVLTGGEDVQVRLTTQDGSVPVGARLDVFGDSVTAEDTEAGRPVDGFGTSAPRVAAVPAVPAPPVAAATTVDPDGAGTGTEEPSGEVVPASTTAATGTPMPAIRLRSAWGAVAPVGEMAVGQVLGATVHHTAGSNDYGAADVPAILRGIQRYHMQSRGWSDIGYNFLVDRYGGIWEGRAGGVTKTQKGVHASMFNGVTTGVSVMGTFESATVTTAIKNSLASLLAWKLALHGVNAAGRMNVYGGSYPAIVGHKDVPDAATACPGRNLYAFLPTLRTMAAQRQVFPRVLVDSDVDGDSVPDLVTAAPGGRAYLGTHDPLQARVRIGNGWNAMDMVVGSPALQGGSAVDLIYREAATGRLAVYHGDGRGGFSGKTVWGLGWTDMSAVVAPGDWTGDGLRDLIAVERSTGYLYLYRGDGKGNLHQRQRIGHGWKNVRSVMAAGDMNGDRATDLVAIVDSTNELRLYAGDGRGGFTTTTSLGAGVAAHDVAAGIGDVTGDGAADVLVRNTATGTMTTVAGNGKGGVAARNTWGSGWGATGALVAAPGWNGNGRPVLITFDQASGLLYSYEATTATRFTPASSVGVVSGATSQVVVGDVTDSGGASVVSRDSGGRLYLHEARGDGTFAAARQIGQGWSGMTQIASASDFDLDGVPDLLALASDGTLSVYPFATGHSGALEAPFVVGRGFGSFRVTGVGGWSRGTSADVLAINRTTGELRWYVGKGRAGLTGGTVIGTGWRNLEITALGDVTGGGNNDLLVRDGSSGTHWVYPANGSGGFAPRRNVSGVPSVIGNLP